MNANDKLTRHIVSYLEEPGDKHSMIFNAWAEDTDHAIDQCEDAYPGCEIVNVTDTGERFVSQ